MADELKFSDRPTQTSGHDVLSILNALGGLGMNIAGLVKGTGAHGNQLLQQSQQHQEQSVVNQRESQKLTDLEKQSAAIFAQATAPGMNLPTTELATLKTMGESRLPNEMQQILRWHESELRQKKSESKQDKNLFAAEARQVIQSLESELENDPNYKIGKVFKAASTLKDRSKSNLQTILRPMAKDKDDLRRLVNQAESFFTDKGYVWDSPRANPGEFFNQEFPGAEAALKKAEVVAELSKLKPGLISPDPKRRAAAIEAFQKYYAQQGQQQGTDEEKKKLIQQITGK